MNLPTDAQIRELYAKAKATNDRRTIYVCKIALDEGVTHRSAKQIEDAKKRCAAIMANPMIPPDFLGMVESWCERNDNHHAEGWLALVLDGTYSVAEMRDAILNGHPIDKSFSRAKEKR